MPSARYANERMGIEQGIERGRDRERQSITINVLQENIPLETIAEATGVTIDQLQQLRLNDINDRQNNPIESHNRIELSHIDRQSRSSLNWMNLLLRLGLSRGYCRAVRF